MEEIEKTLIQFQDKTIQLGDAIGKGGYGVVYKGLTIETGEIVAIKQVRYVNIPKDQLTTIMVEIDLLKNLRHANIVKYIGYFRTKEYLHIILEFVESGSLQGILKKFGKFPEPLVVVYMTQVLAGLVYLHEQGVIHRDIKGANILTTKEGHVKLADFGVATKLGDPKSDQSTVVGTPYWMAPEIIELCGATTKSDIWSVGCTIVELLTGIPPYFDLAPMPALFRIVQDDCPPLPENISPALKDFLMQCFQKEPQLRVSASKLLKHPWLTKNTKKEEQNKKVPSTMEDLERKLVEHNQKTTRQPEEIRPSNLPPPETDDDDWGDDFADVSTQDFSKLKAQQPQPVSPTPLTKQKKSKQKQQHGHKSNKKQDSSKKLPSQVPLTPKSKSSNTPTPAQPKPLSKPQSPRPQLVPKLQPAPKAPIVDDDEDDWDAELGIVDVPQAQLSLGPKKPATPRALPSSTPSPPSPQPSKSSSSSLLPRLTLPPQTTSQSLDDEEEENWDDLFGGEQPLKLSLNPVAAASVPLNSPRVSAPLPPPEEDDDNWDDVFATGDVAKVVKANLPSRTEEEPKKKKIETTKKIPGSTTPSVPSPLSMSTPAPSVSKTESEKKKDKLPKKESKKKASKARTLSKEKPGGSRMGDKAKTLVGDSIPESFSATDLGDEDEFWPEESFSNGVDLASKLKEKMCHTWGDDPFDSDEEDPFANVFDDFDDFANFKPENDTASQVREIVRLLSLISPEQSETIVLNATEDLLAIIKRNPDFKSYLVRYHGILPLMSLFEFTSPKVLRPVLKVVNFIIIEDPEIQESLCLVGCIPAILRYLSDEYPLEAHQQAALFIKQLFSTSDVALQMFIACGGLPSLSWLFKYRYEEETKNILWMLIDCLNTLFFFDSYTHKKDFCYLFLKTRLLEGLAQCFQRLMEDKQSPSSILLQYKEKVVNILLIFSQADTAVKVQMSSSNVMKPIVSKMGQLPPSLLVIVLKSIKYLTSDDQTLNNLQQSGVIESLIPLLQRREGPLVNEMHNQILLTLFNLCRIDKERQELAAKGGLIPHLQYIIKLKDSPLKQFAYPIFCDMGHTPGARPYLWAHNAVQFYISILSSPYWQVVALSALSAWLADETQKIEPIFCQLENIRVLIECFQTAQSVSFVNLVESFFRIITISRPIAAALGKEHFTGVVIQRLRHPNPVVRITVLKILTTIFDCHPYKRTLIKKSNLIQVCENLLNDKAVMVVDLASKLLAVCRTMSASPKKNFA